MSDDLDPDLIDHPPLSASQRPAHFNPRLLVLIAAGGAAGTLVRALLEEVVPAMADGWPWMTFFINVSGALVLGVLLEVLARTGPDTGWRRAVRLTAGTGFLGGYTTYSTFAVEVVQRTTGSARLLGPAYALASVILGTGAAAAGYLLARRIGTKPQPGNTP